MNQRVQNSEYLNEIKKQIAQSLKKQKQTREQNLLEDFETIQCQPNLNREFYCELISDNEATKHEKSKYRNDIAETNGRSVLEKYLGVSRSQFRTRKQPPGIVRELMSDVQFSPKVEKTSKIKENENSSVHLKIECEIGRFSPVIKKKQETKLFRQIQDIFTVQRVKKESPEKHVQKIIFENSSENLTVVF